MRRPRPELALLGAAVLLALALRLVDPLRFPVLAAEDPILHLFRAERLANKGLWPQDYPPGFPAVLVAMQSFGLGLYDVARLAPAFWGAVGTLACAGAARKLAGPWAGVGSAWLFATVPELVRRGDFLAPTAYDLALLPVLAWLLLEALDGRREALAPMAVAAAWLYVAHPWGLAYLAVGLAPFLLWRVRANLAGSPRRAWAALAGLAAVAVPLLFLVRVPELGREMLGVVVLGRVAGLAGSLAHYQWPWMVDPLAMLGVPALLLACVGAMRAPRALRVLGGGWVLALLPLVLLDVTGVRYVPMRSVAYLAPGIALLGGGGVAWLVGQARTQPWARPAPRRTAVVACALAGLLVLAGTGAAAKGWYRIYPESDQKAFQRAAAGAQEAGARVVVGTWQSSVQLGAWGADVRAEPRFFQNASFRASFTHREMHDLAFLVVVDKEARLRANATRPEFANFSLGFLQGLTALPITGKYAAVYVDQPALPPDLRRPGGVMGWT